MLKVEGRLSRSCFAAPFKHQTVIPQGQHITKLIIAHCHERIKQQGKGFTINEIKFTVTCRESSVKGQRKSDLPVE